MTSPTEVDKGVLEALRGDLSEALAANEQFAQRERQLKEELARMTRECESLRLSEAKGPPLTLPGGSGKELVGGNDTGLSIPGKRDLGLQTMVAPWGGDARDIPVEDFLTGVELVAASGYWTDADKALVVRMRLKGQAAAFLGSRRDLQGPQVQYITIKEALIHRFRDRVKPEDYLLRLHALRQAPGEAVQPFADRCRAMGEKALGGGPDALAASSATGRIILAAFLNGLRGEVGRLLRMSPPADLEEAVGRAVVAEMELSRGDLGDTIAARVEKPKPLLAEGQPKNQGPCFRCGLYGHRLRNCPTPDRQRGAPRGACFRCGRPGHIMAECERDRRPVGTEGPPKERRAIEGPPARLAILPATNPNEPGPQ